MFGREWFVRYLQPDDRCDQYFTKMESEKKHRHHRKHKHKKHKKHRRSKDTNDGPEDSDQDVGLQQIDYSIPHMDGIVGDDDINIGDPSQSTFILDGEHCDGTIEVIEEQLVEIDDAIGTINIEEMVLENYGQEYGEELEVDVGGIDDENGDDLLDPEEFDEELIEEAVDCDSEEEELEESNDQEPLLKLEPKAETARSVKVKQRDKDRKNKDEGDISSAEEAWLDALESGKLEEVDDELKKIRNPKLMTARQRALLERKGEIQNEENFKEELVALPTGYKETVMTEEALQKKALKSQRRREVAAQKREKEKKRTIDRLLQKRESKGNKLNPLNSSTAQSGSASAAGASSSTISRYSWRQTADGQCWLTIPPSVPFFQQSTPCQGPARPVLCAVAGCTNVKRYNCARTRVPLCSLACYRNNLNSCAGNSNTVDPV